MATVTAGTPYQELIQAIADYYGSGSDQWLEVAKYGVKADDFIDIVNQLPNYEVVTNKAGDIIGYQKIDSLTLSNPASAVNSNVTTAPVKVSTPATVVESSGEVVASKGIATTSGLQFITKSVLPAVAAAGVGVSVAKTFYTKLYNANPEFWDSIGMSTINPETWAVLTADMSDSTGEMALATAFNLLFGIDPNTNKSQAYIDQNAFAYLALYMQTKNLFGGSAVIDDPTGLDMTNMPIPMITSDAQSFWGPAWVNPSYYSKADRSGVNCAFFVRYSGDNILINRYYASEEPFNVLQQRFLDGDPRGDIITTPATVRTINGKEVYAFFDASVTNKNEVSVYGSYNLLNGDLPVTNTILYILTYGDVENAPEGTGNQINAVLPQLSNSMTVNEALTALQTQYPDIFNNAITYPVMQPDGTTTNYMYVPIALPDAVSAVDPHPTASGEYITQNTPQYDPATMPDSVWESLYDILRLSPTETDTPTDTTGDGNTPAIVPPTGSASALWRIYNPSQGQLDAFGAWLWSSNFVDQLLKVFNDPMQAIIGLHKIFVNPPVSGSGAIKVGYLVSDASANYVSGQYVDVDCGSVTLDEYFNNVFDYESTEVSIYLPFSGIHRLNTSDVMRGNINVKYHVDVLTGACLIDISVTRDAAGGVLYTFSGNCAVQYPVSSGSYVGIVTGLLGIAGGITGTIASGGMLAPLLMGAGASIGNMHTNVSHSGNISSNAGAMGAKIPYLIIERPQTKTPPTAVAIEGLPQNDIVTLSMLTGLTRVKKARYDGISCTSDELNIIRGLLESGVYIN